MRNAQGEWCWITCRMLGERGELAPLIQSQICHEPHLIKSLVLLVTSVKGPPYLFRLSSGGEVAIGAIGNEIGSILKIAHLAPTHCRLVSHHHE